MRASVVDRARAEVEEEVVAGVKETGRGLLMEKERDVEGGGGGLGS